MFQNPTLRRCLLLAAFVFLCFTAWLLRHSFVESVESRTRTALDERWGAMKGYLRIETVAGHDRPLWYADKDDEEEARMLAQIRNIYLLADKDGHPVEISPAYQAIDKDAPTAIRTRVREAFENDRLRRSLTREKTSARVQSSVFWLSRRNGQGSPFLIRAGLLYNELGNEPYYAAIGVPIGHQENAEMAFTWTLAGLIGCAVLLGWMLNVRV